MDIKDKATVSRNALQQGIYRVINPLVKLMISCGMTPNHVTTIGFLGNLAAAFVLGYAAYVFDGANHHYTMVTISGALIIGFSLFDMLDGQVARLGGMASTFGALYDSVLDRYCELFTLSSIAYYLLATDHAAGALMATLALVGSIMVSYVRARGEGLGVVCKIGFMQRPERVVLTSLALLATGICGQCGVHFLPDAILIAVMAFMALFTNITAVARIGWCFRELDKRA